MLKGNKHGIHYVSGVGALSTLGRQVVKLNIMYIFLWGVALTCSGCYDEQLVSSAVGGGRGKSPIPGATGPVSRL